MLLLLSIIGAFLLVGLVYFFVPREKPIDIIQEPPAKVEILAEGAMSRVVLTSKAAERLGIETVAVDKIMEGEKEHLLVPYAALLYDENGETWVYTTPERLTYVRHRVVVDRIEGDKVMLLEGPRVGTVIVTIGIAELIGVERGLGK